MSHQRARLSAKTASSLYRILWGISSPWLVACTSAELEVPPTHPGHPQASAGRVAWTEALTKRYALAPTTQSAAPSDEHAQHEHGAQVAPGATAKATQGASQPDGAAVFTCPMHPEVVRAEPGKCPSCGMNLVPKKDAK